VIGVVQARLVRFDTRAKKSKNILKISKLKFFGLDVHSLSQLVAVNQIISIFKLKKLTTLYTLFWRRF